MKEKFGESVHSDSQQITGKEKLYEYIRKIYRTTEVSSMIDKQVENYCVEYKLTYYELYFVLWYFFELEGNPVTSDGIGIVPYIISEVQKYLTDKQKSDILNEKEIKKGDWKVAMLEVKSVPYRNNLSGTKLIDIEDL
jgi:hypothetical protein